MKKRDNTYLQRFNRIVFVGLITLIMALMLFFVSGIFKWSDHDFALSDFENETMGQAWFAKQNGNHAAEIQLYKQVLEKIPVMEAGLSCKIGKAEYQLGNYLEAITWFNRSLKAERPDSSEVFFHVAMTAQKLKRYSMAEKYYQMVIHHLEYGKEASFNMGNIYLFEYDNQEKALEYYSKAITLPTINNE